LKQKPDFLEIAFEEGCRAWLEGKLQDSEYVRKKTYQRYEKEVKEWNSKKGQEGT